MEVMNTIIPKFENAGIEIEPACRPSRLRTLIADA